MNEPIEQTIREIDGTMAIEGMPLTEEDKTRMRDLLSGKQTIDDLIGQLNEKHIGEVETMPKPKTDLTSELVKEYALNAGAAVVGIAAASDFGAAPEGYKPTDALEGCVSVIVLGAPIPRESVLKENMVGFIDIRSALNKDLKAAAQQVAKQIKVAGYQSRAIGGMDGKWVDGSTRGPISLKHAAELAGLGVIGKNYLLTNPEHGNLLWFSAVLTDAPLTPDPKLALDFCGGCNLCIEACPGHALDTPSIAKKACDHTVFKQVDKKWEIICFECRKVCPYRFGI